MAGSTATRLWRVCKEAGRPFPSLDEDDVIDFMITEAVALKVDKEDAAAQKKAEVKDWKADKEGLDKLREAVG